MVINKGLGDREWGGLLVWLGKNIYLLNRQDAKDAKKEERKKIGNVVARWEWE
ncbi:hypothetical protein [Microseira sp. BLCC-F43]|jgi:hypothetical protein|uniref:hypothetical protein n=1 Tax=Microseira sp. BLCC-F43 TaxID=3153602 RepID=UPI0035B6B357